MDEKERQELEDSFRNRNQTLRAFYDSNAQELSCDERESLTPILNSLKDNINRYQEIDKIAEGGEKKITLVHDHRLDRCVAMARAARAKTAQEQEQFLREARLTANLAHPNIMPVYNMGLDDEGEPFFSMELISGDSLKTIINRLKAGDEAYRQDYPLEQLLNIFNKVCDAVAYAHSRNVLHLDIKPDNIKVGPYGEVFLCDWGLARVINEIPSGDTEIGDGILDADVLNDMTLSGTMKGTPGFMAPEQTLAYSEKTPHTDVYALGALLYVLLTYELPVLGSSANEVVQNTREGRVISPRKRHPDHPVPKGLSAVALKALSLKPEDRYATVLSLQKEITRHLGGYPTRAEQAGWWTKTSLMLQRHSRFAAGIMVSLVVLAAVISANMVAISREKTEAVTAREEAEANFELYRKEQLLARKLEENLDQAVLFTVKSRDFVNAPSMIHVLERGLTENLDAEQRSNLLAQKGTLHFVLQQFNAALDCFAEAGDSRQAQAIASICLEFAELKASDDARLDDEQVARLIRQAKSVRNVTLYYLYYHHVRRRPAFTPPEEYVPLARAMLDKLNDTRRSQKNRFALVKREDGYHLDLSGSKYNFLSVNIIGVYRRNILAPLKLTSLDISGMKLDSFAELRGLKLDELRMVGIKAQSRKSLPKSIENMRLKRVVLSVDDYSKKTIKELRKFVEVIDAN